MPKALSKSSRKLKIELTTHSVKTGKKDQQFALLHIGEQLQMFDNAAHPFGYLTFVDEGHILIHFKMDEPRFDEDQPKAETQLVPIQLLRP